jgi:TolA-binding protein
LNCERFDQDSLELLYDELDDVSASALRRHVAACPRCQPTWQKLVLVRAAARIPLEAPEPDLLSDVLSRQKSARRTAPLGERVGHFVSIMAEYAMRPQLAMAALLVLMVGSSLVFVRSGPGRGDQVRVREVGSPSADGPTARSELNPPLGPQDEPHSGLTRLEAEATRPSEVSAKDGATAAKRAFSTAPSTSDLVLPPTYEEAMRAYQDGRYAEAERLFGEVSKTGGEKAGAAALHEAHAARNGSGCQRAASYYDEVALRFEGSSVASEAAWHAALCYRALGQSERARAHLERLRSEPAYQARVEKLLHPNDSALVATRAARLSETSSAEARPTASAPADMKAKPVAPAKPSSPSAKPAASQPAGKSQELGGL